MKSVQSFSFAACSSLDASQRFDAPLIEFSPDRLSDGDLVLDDGDLPRSLYRLKTVAPRRYEDFLYAVYSLFPSFQSISVDAYEVRQEVHDRLSESLPDGDEELPIRIRDELYRVTVRDESLNQPVDISRMSTGTKRIIWLVTNVIIASEIGAGCVGVEEVETSIHPRMLESLLEILEENQRGTSLILTSHSPYLIQYLKPGNVYVGVPSRDGVATFRKIAPGGVHAVIENARSRGLGYGDHLFELMSGGDDGMRALAEFLEA
ncbi:ATP-binding protein [Thermophilibacter sp. ET337]|uniref:ATP-binding protein n=1 Tax=Thermophilibacter sp. ET337 TaxID=2973084 RepID=UPI0021AD3E45|nr:ATP-binding protein [Thermophilibacter sp. ET337]MCR8908842.1 ATP-binding protein [Thermophilibacter sp. ET337]